MLTPLLAEDHSFPPKIGPTALGILQSTLARGVVLCLVRDSGWRVEKGRGRLWDRHPTPKLEFTEWSFRLLRGLLTRHLLSECPPLVPGERLGDGDHILALRVAQALVSERLELGLQLVAHAPLVQLAYGGLIQAEPVDWVDFLTGRTWMIEGLSGHLAEGMLLAELDSLIDRSPQRVIARSTRRRRIYDGFLDAIDRLDRRDLVEPLLRAGERLIPDPAQPPGLGAIGLDPSTSLGERMEARAASTVLLDALIRVEGFHHRDRTVRFFDEDYDAAQRRLARWEPYTDARADAVHRARAELLAPPRSPTVR